MKDSKITKVKQFTFIIILITASFFMLACPMPTLLAKESSLNITISSEESPVSRGLETVRFVYEGTGPSGRTFSVESYEQQITVRNLKAGEWTVQTTGYNSNNEIVVTGQSPMTVTVYGETKLTITLSPAEGEGNIRIKTSWDNDYTVNPSVKVVITSSDGNETTEYPDIISGRTVEMLTENLETGFYRLSIQLFDDGELTAGSVSTVMVLNNITTVATEIFDTINKTGERIVVSDSSFSLAWDTDSETDEFYRVYARSKGTYDWILVDEISAEPNPEFEITTSNLNYGVWEFAVSSVEGGIESAIHTCMDDNAIPSSGWYIDWVEI